MKTFSKINSSFIGQLLLFGFFFFVGGIDGFGQFGEEQIITGHTDEPSSVFASDLDGDGDLDMLSASFGDDKIAWYENDGAGNFGVQKIITTNADGAKSVYAADLDGDGDIDVLSASHIDDKIAWYENDGNGNFGTQQIITTNTDGANSVYAADLDGDGDLDVLSASYDDEIAWYENDGAGNFGGQQIITTNADFATSVYAVDLDGDGDLDVLSASYGDDIIAWYENDGLGNFGAQQIITTNADGTYFVYAADMDGDGDMDVLSASWLDNKIAWYENDGLGNFGGQQIITSSALDAFSVYAADLDGDGDLDVLSASSWDGKIAWYENDGLGNFGGQQIITSNATYARSVYAADLDGDGDLDVLSASIWNSKIAWYENSGTGNFGEQQIITTNAQDAYSVYVADLDGDGDMDVLSASSYGGHIAWYENDGSGNFGEQQIITIDALFARSVYASDLDGDGDLDVLSASIDDDKIAWYENDGLGNFGEQQIITSSAQGAFSVYAADLDEDGDMDVLSASRNDDKIAWYENDGLGNFGSQQVITTNADGAYSVYATDLDGDGDTDVLSASSYGGNIAWYENDGFGDFSEQQIITTNTQDAYSVYATDIDGDGDMDVISASSWFDMIAWYENDGSGNFGEQQIITANADGARSVYAVDIDGDGDMDVLSASNLDDKIAWYENDGSGNFGEQQIITTNTDYAIAVYAADIDGDGDMDVLSASGFDDKIAWYENIINEGCTDPTACNYSEIFVFDNGSCCYDNCGCTNINANNYDSLSDCDDGSCILMGCVDNTACNFEFYTNTDDGSCNYPGCIDINAQNYDSIAECNDFSCTYILLGQVFFDENENGIFDELDYGLPFQEITSSDDLIYLTNDEGLFYADATSQSIFFTLSSNESFPFNTTSNPQTIVNGINTSTNDLSLNFGISSELPDFAICLDFYPSGSGYPCDDWVNHNLCYRNMGNVPINGILEIEYDPLFQDYQEVTPIDSVVGNIIYMSFENLMPGQMYFYDVSFHTPDFESIGEFLTSTGRVYGYYEGEEVAFGESILVQEMTCAYDPNDKQVFPAGYTDPHYVLPETRLEYLVRFQNTGNAPATDVLVTDTIDSSLDLNTFELVANSHSVITTIKTEERVIEFLFENIMLPDSIENEPESHGLISYKLTPLNDLDFETEINNTAYIYFDNNPPIVTNTAWSTIYDCNNGLATFEILDSLICQGAAINFENTQNYIEEYAWYISDENISSESILIYSFETANQFTVNLEVSNPICEALDSLVITVIPSPEIVVSEDITLCEGESTTLTVTGSDNYDWNGEGTDLNLEVTPDETTTYEVTATNEFDCSSTAEVTVFINPLPTAEITADQITLTAVEAETYQWYLNGNPIDGANAQTYVAQQNGNYSVEVTNEFDCTSLSDEIIISVVGINELVNTNIQLFPNPMQEFSMLYFGESGVEYQIKLFTTEGKLVQDYGIVTDGQLEIQRKGLSSGSYLVEVVKTNSNKKFTLKLVIE